MFGAITTALQLAATFFASKGGRTDHCGNVSSQRMCLRLQVLQPFRLLVWLRREGPAPWFAISKGGMLYVKMQDKKRPRSDRSDE